MMRTIGSLLEARAAVFAEAVALAGLHGERWTYRTLSHQASRLVGQLRTAGIGPRDVVATLLPNGPVAAATLLALASGTVIAPLNPELPAAELRALLERLRPRSLVVASTTALASHDVAREVGIDVLTIRSAEGVLELVGERRPASGEAAVLAPPGAAAIIATSGTTGHPALVVLGHRALLDAAAVFAEILELGPEDRSVNALPLFHTHGFTAAILASITAGASVVCAPGFQAARFLGWLQDARATWYTATPFMHRAILAHAAEAQDRSVRLRVVRSSSSPLPEATRRELGERFSAPVIDSYGMTEATPIASTRLHGPAPKPGSVGTPVGLEVAALDEAGRVLPRGHEGRIGVRGETLLMEYWRDAEATRRAYHEGWFLTGDVGRLDDDGALFLTGREKDEIDCGGEKVSPSEVEAALLTHPAVVEAAVFGVRRVPEHESVVAAVVARPELASPSLPSQLAAHVLERLAGFKVPSEIVQVEALPRSATGKLQRASLAQALAERLAAAKLPAAGAGDDDDVRRRLREVWAASLGHSSFTDTTDFFAVGGDSILAGLVATTVRRELGVVLSPRVLFEARTIAGLAAAVAHERSVRIDVAGAEATTTDEHPVSFEQEIFARHHESNPKLSGNTLILAFRGPLDVGRLREGLEWVHRRHEGLRTTYHRREGTRTAKVHEPAALELPRVDARAAGHAARAAVVRDLLDELNAAPLLVDRGPHTRALVAETAPGEHLLLFTYSHTNTDRWSIAVILRELLDRYCAGATGAASKLGPPSAQYREYAEAQRRAAPRDRAVTELAAWKERLAGRGAAAPLAAATLDDVEPGLCVPHGLTLPPPTLHRLRSVADERGCTLPSMLLHAYGTLLAQHCGGSSVLVRCFVNSPLRYEPRFESTVGCFVDMKPVLVSREHGVERTMDELWRAQGSIVPGVMHDDDPAVPRPWWGLNYRGRIPPPMTFSLPGVGARFHTTGTLAAGLDLPELGLELRPVPDPREVVMLQEPHELFLGADERDGALQCVLWSQRRHVLRAPTVEQLVAELRDALERLSRGAEP